MEISSQFEILINVITAAFLGGIIGWERETNHISAGLRTHMLIAASAATIVALGAVLIESYYSMVPGGTISADPLKIFEAIVVGVSFIGGGIIFRNQNDEHVHNLTTAASILVTSGIGVSVALHQFFFAVGLTLLVVFINHVLFFVERKAIK